MKRLHAGLITISLVIAGLLGSSLPASATDTIDVYLETVPGVNLGFSAPSAIEVSGTKLFFAQGGTLYAHDSALNTTVNLLPAGAYPEYPQYAIVNGKLVFGANLNDGHGSELYISDGTVAGTTLLKDINPGSGSSTSRFFMQYGNKAVFVIFNTVASHYELWITDGSSLGTTKIVDLSMIGVESSAVLNGRLYFEGSPLSGGALTVWSTDGVTASQVSAITPNESGLTTFGDWVYFNGDATSSAISNRSSGVTGWELLRTNGTVTEIAADVNPTTNNSSWSKPTSMAALDNNLYFAADDGVHGRELMKFDGTTVSLVKDEAPGAASSNPWNLTAYNGRIFYSNEDSAYSRELYVSDGTTSGTGLLSDIYPGTTPCDPNDRWCRTPTVNSSYPSLFTAYDGRLIFAATNGVVGGEIFEVAPPVVVVQSVAPSAAPVVYKYAGPGFNAIVNRKFDATVGGRVTVSGTRLGSISRVALDGKEVKILSNTDSELEFLAPASKPGTPELTVTFSSGSLTWVNALTYLDPEVEKAKLANRQPPKDKPTESKPTKAKPVKKPKNKN